MKGGSGGPHYVPGQLPDRQPSCDRVRLCQGAAGDAPTPEEQQAEALARDEAQALVETVVGRSLYGPLSLEALPAGRTPPPRKSPLRPRRKALCPLR